MLRKYLAGLIAAVCTTGGVVGVATAAGAVAPPPNDTIAHAQLVTTLPFKATVDTRGATTDKTDAQLNQVCGAPHTNNSVWYEYKATKSMLLVVDTTGSNFSSGALIAEGTPGSLATVACSRTQVSLDTAPGNTYWILLFDDTTNGGTLQVDIHGPGPKPVNDTSSGAKVVGSLPYHDTLDTTGATSDAQDTQADKTCGAPAITNTVWYKFTAGANNTNVLVDATNSTYLAGVIVATGTPGNLTTVACGPGYAITPTTPGTTYWIIAFDFEGQGGALDLKISEAPPAPTIKVDVKPVVGVGPKGKAYVHATYTCTNAQQAEAIVELVEIVGNTVAYGLVDQPVDGSQCDGTAHGFDGLITPRVGKFAPGKAAEFRDGIACNDLQCATYDTTAVAHLVAGAKAPAGATTTTHFTWPTAPHTLYTSHRAPAPWARTWGK